MAAFHRGHDRLPTPGLATGRAIPLGWLDRMVEHVDEYRRRVFAFDEATGAEVRRGATSYRPHANPMTCRARSGRQLIVIATGGGDDARSPPFARPGQGDACFSNGQPRPRGCARLKRKSVFL